MFYLNLLLHVTGDLKLTYKVDFDLHKGKGNKEYVQLKNPKLDFKAEKFRVHLTNLFNGDKTLGKYKYGRYLSK